MTRSVTWRTTCKRAVRPLASLRCDAARVASLDFLQHMADNEPQPRQRALNLRYERGALRGDLSRESPRDDHALCPLWRAKRP